MPDARQVMHGGWPEHLNEGVSLPMVYLFLLSYIYHLIIVIFSEGESSNFSTPDADFSPSPRGSFLVHEAFPVM